jgi:hypothetical protein
MMRAFPTSAIHGGQSQLCEKFAAFAMAFAPLSGVIWLGFGFARVE